MTESLAEALPKEMARVRDEIMPRYLELPEVSGRFALAMMRRALDGAAKAMMEGDVVAMMRWYQDLQGFEQ